MTLNEIPAWSEIESQPWFAELTPEEKQQSLQKWQGTMMQFASDPKEKFAVAATSKAKARSFFGEEMPDDPIADALQRRQKDLEDIGSRYDAFSKGQLEEDDEEVLTLNDTLKGNTPYSVIKGRLFVSPQLVWDKAAYEKVVNEAPVDEDERVLAMSAYEGSKERAAEGVVNSLGYTDEAFRDFAAKGFKEGKSNAAVLDEWKANNKLPEGILGSLRGVGRQAYFGLRSGLSGLEQALGGLGGFFGSESAQKYAEESGKEAQSYMQRTLGEGPEFIGELTAGATSIIPTIAAGAAASFFTEGAALPAAASITAGAIQSAGATQAETYEFYRNQGLDHANALAESRVDGLVAGVVTGAVTKYANLLGSKIGLGKGIEGLFSGPVGQFANKITQKELSVAFREGAKAIGGAALQEGFEEGADQLAQDVYSRIKRDPTLTLPEIMTNTIKAAQIGGALGGAAEGAKLALGKALNASKFAVPTTEQDIKTAAEVSVEAAPLAPETAAVLADITEESAGELAAEVTGATEDALANIEAEAPLVADETPLVSPEPPVSPAGENAPIGETPVASFQTSKGSTYDLLPDGTTIRNKAARPEHPGEEGVQPRSSKTIFVTEEGANALGIVQAEGVPFEIRQRKDGTWGAVALEGPSKGKFYKTSLTSASEAPAVGLIPVELWNRPGKKQAVHFGNKIASVSAQQPQPPQGQPPETPTDALPLSPTTSRLPSKERPEMGLQQVGEGNAQPEEVAETRSEEEVAVQKVFSALQRHLNSGGEFQIPGNPPVRVTKKNIGQFSVSEDGSLVFSRGKKGGKIPLPDVAVIGAQVGAPFDVLSLFPEDTAAPAPVRSSALAIAESDNGPAFDRLVSLLGDRGKASEEIEVLTSKDVFSAWPVLVETVADSVAIQKGQEVDTRAKAESLRQLYREASDLPPSKERADALEQIRLAASLNITNEETLNRRKKSPTTGTVPTEPLPAGRKVTLRGVASPAVARDTTKPEQMTLKQFEKSKQRGGKAPNVFFDVPLPRTQQAETQTQQLRETYGSLRGIHRGLVSDAIEDRKPVLADAADEYGWDMPEGYVKQGELYVYEKTQPLPKGDAAGQRGAVAPAPTAEPAPEVQPEQPAVTEPVSPQVQAFRDAVAQMTPTAQAKWTPELRATAEAYLDSGGTTELDGLTAIQKAVVQRLLPRTPEQEAADAAEEARNRKMAAEDARFERSTTFKSSSLPPIPSKKTRKLGAKGMEVAAAALDEIAKVIPNIRELVEVRESFEGEPDAEGFYDPQTDKTVVLANNVFLKDHHAGSEAMAMRETIVHELLHRGFAKLRQTNPQLFQQFEAFSVTDTNDNLLDALVRRGYTMYANWRNDPVQAQKAREEVFVRKAALDLAVNGLDAIKSPTSLASQFFKWFKEFLSKLLGRVPPQNQLVHWAQVFLNAAQADFIEKTPGERMHAFAGEKAIENLPEERRQFMRDSLDTAKAMAAAGKDSEEIRAATGWFPGKYDGKMRWEVPDEGAEWRQVVSSPPYPVRIEQVLKHPNLFSVYPNLKDVLVVFDNDLPANMGANFNAETKAITVNNQKSDAEKLSSVLHEIQHWIQEDEGFPRGSSPKEMGFAPEAQRVFDSRIPRLPEIRSRLNEIKERQRALSEELRGMGDERYSSPQVKESMALSEEVSRLLGEQNDLERQVRPQVAMGLYRSVAGEIEARDVQARKDLTPEQRAATAPYSSENIAPEDAIVLFGGGGAQMSMAQGRDLLSPEKYARHAELEAKHNAGTITPEETAEAQALVDEAAKGAGYGTKLFHGTTATEDVLIRGKEPGEAAAEAEKGLRQLAEKYGVSEWRYTDAYPRMLAANYKGITQQEVDTALKLKRAYLDATEGVTPDTNEKRIAFNVFNMPSGEQEFGVHVGNKGAASMFGEVFPFWVKLGKQVRLPDLGTWGYQAVIRELRKKGVQISGAEYDLVFDSSDPNSVLRQMLRDKGFESIVYLNEAEGRGDSYILTAPSQIKSADPFTGVPLEQRFQPESPDIRYALGEPDQSAMDVIREKLNTFIDENKATNSFLEAFGPVRVERMQQQGEKLGPEYIQAQVRPLMQRAQAALGFEMDEEGNYVLSQKATDKAHSVLAQWLQDGRKFAKAYNKKAEKFFDKLFPGMEEIPVDSDMAAAVLLHEIMSYAKALAAASPKAEDQILLDMVRPQYGSVVLANYDLTMHKSGRTLQTARNYSEGTELGQDAVENANKKGEEKVKEELGDEALPSATEEGKVGLEAGVDAAPDLPAVDPTLRLLDLAVESLDDVAKAKTESVFNILFDIGQLEELVAEDEKRGDKAMSILRSPNLAARNYPTDPAERKALLAQKKAELATALDDALASLQGAKPETKKKVKTKAAKTKSKTDSVQKLIDKLAKMPDEAKEAKPKAETLRSVLNDAIKAKDFDEQKVRDAAGKAGSTPEQADRLVEEAKRLHEIAQDKTPSKTKLRKFLLSHPQETLYNPEQRQALVKTFLRTEIKMSEPEIARYLPKFESNFVKAMEDAREKYLDGLETRFNAPKKARESRVDAQNRKLLQALRAGLAETKSPKVALLEKLGFKEFKPTDKHVIAKLDSARTEALANGEFAKARLKQTELSSLLLRRRPPMGWMQLLNQAWITSALSSFRNLALNVWTPLGEAVSRYFGALASALKTGDFTAVTALTKALGEAFRRVPARFKFAYSANTFTQQANAAIAEQASLIDEFRRSLSQLRDKKLSKKDRTKAATRVIFSFGDYSRRLLQTIDESWFSVLESFISSANLLSDVNKYGIKAEALTEASVHFATQAKNDAYAASQIVDRLSDYLDSLKGKTTAEIQQALELYRMDQLGISPENLTFTNEMLDVIEQLRLRSGVEGDALLKAAKRNINDYRRLAWVRAAEKADADTRGWVSALLTGKGVKKVDVDQVLKDATEGSERAASYGMGLHRVEEAPALDIGNTFAKMIEAMGQQAIRVNPMLGRMMVGFFGIPVNLMNKSLWFAPGYGLLRYYAFRKMAERHPDKQFYAYSLANEKERAQRFREVMFGHAVFGLLAALGAFDDRDEEETEGLYVTLGGPANKTEKDAWLARGFRPYSICIKHEDGSVTSIPYGVGAGEFMKMPLMAAGAFDDMRLNKKLGNREDMSSALEYFNAFAAGVGRQATFLGAKNTVGALLPDTFGAGTVANLAFAAGNFFPFNGLDRSLETLMSGPPDRSRTGAILANIPYLRHFEALGARPATNVFGDPWGSKTADPIEIIEDRLLSQSISVWNTSKPLTGQDKKLYEFIGRYQIGPNGPQRGALELRNGYLTDQEWANYRDVWAANAKREWLSSLDRMARMDEDGRAKAAAELSTKASRKAKSRFNYE